MLTRDGVTDGAAAAPGVNPGACSFISFLWALSRRLVAQEETSNRHQCQSE